MVGQVELCHLGFETRLAEVISSAGRQITRLVEVGMPKIPQYVLNSVFFSYCTRDDAEKGENPMGTGFLAAVPSVAISRVACPPHVYAISNWHVICDAPVIRLHTSGGRPIIIDDLDPAMDWRWVAGGHPHQGDDVAIVPIDLDGEPEVMTIPIDLFMTEKKVTEQQIGVGDDAFMIGLFVDHYTRGATLPKARFGNISMMPSDTTPIEQPNKTTKKSSFVLDMHSRSGFSGSPVFFFRTVGADLDHANSSNIILNKPAMFGLLGLHWGQFTEEFKAPDECGKFFRLEGMSGMTCAIPAWRLLSLFDLDPLPGLREKREAIQRKKLAGLPRAESEGDS
jgi:hypothetical protein